MFDATNIYHGRNKAYSKRNKAFSDKLFCDTKCFDHSVIFEVRQVESLELNLRESRDSIL